MESLASQACTCPNFQRMGEPPVAPPRSSLKPSSVSCNQSPQSAIPLKYNGRSSYPNNSRFFGNFSYSRPDDDVFVSAGSRMAAAIKATVNEYPLVMYTKTRCAYGIKAKSLFLRLGVEPLVVELDELGPIQQQIRNALKKLTGQSTVPYIFVGGRFIGGCSDTMLLHRKGELVPLLKASGLRVSWYQENPVDGQKFSDRLQLVA